MLDADLSGERPEGIKLATYKLSKILQYMNDCNNQSKIG